MPIGVAALLTMPWAVAQPPMSDTVARLRVTRRPRLLVWYALLLISALLSYSLAVFLPQRLAEIGIHAPFLVAVYAVVLASLAGSLVGLVYACLRTRLSNAVIVRLAVAAWVASLVLYALVEHPVPLLVAPALWGLRMGLLFPVVTVPIDNEVPPALRGRAAALSGTAVFTGQFCSPLVFGPLITATTPATGFLAAAGLALLMLLGVSLLRPRPTADSTAETRGDTTP
ncbi:hypothetical protein LZG04_11940 [Saccharothrix sp. S26]|uniref:hypothetical protein n=1 Tax=Saccharothrix sp. S26 TaxID=2907215 RepID=UPI001F15F995|nr:hypothetical protein [Saccharothrix sp. S26]MCE6995508.1 hypothetical protein [Saccharothrix sp. S26]